MKSFYNVSKSIKYVFALIFFYLPCNAVVKYFCNIRQKRCDNISIAMKYRKYSWHLSVIFCAMWDLYKKSKKPSIRAYLFPHHFPSPESFETFFSQNRIKKKPNIFFENKKPCGQTSPLRHLSFPKSLCTIFFSKQNLKENNSKSFKQIQKPSIRTHPFHLPLIFLLPYNFVSKNENKKKNCAHHFPSSKLFHAVFFHPEKTKFQKKFFQK